MIVPPEGPLDAKIILVGEAPGDEENKTGRPFIGSAGKELDRLLARAGITRGECYVLNVVREQPKDNNIALFLSARRPAKDRLDNYTQDEQGMWVTREYLLYKEMLLRDLERASGKVVVVMGGTALYALTGLKGIEKHRGSMYTHSRLPGKIIIPTIHPSASLRMFIYKYYILFDLQRAMQTQANSDISLLKRALLTSPTFEQTMAYLNECFTYKRIGFDIETIRTAICGKFQDWEMSCFSVSKNKLSSMCIPLMRENRDSYFTPQQELAVMSKLKQLLEDPEIAIIIQNAMFDVSFELRKCGIITRNIHDTMIAQGILLPDFPKGLGFLCSIYTNEPFYKDDGKQHTKYGSTLKKFWEYNAKDSIVLHEILDKLLVQLEQQGNLETYEATRRLLHPLLFMQARGIRMDTEGMANQAVLLKAEAEGLQSELDILCRHPLNPNSPKQVKEYFYTEKKQTPYRTKGRVTCDEKALTRLANKGFKEATLILAIRRTLKLKNTYMSMTLDEDDRLRCSANPVGTVTGRLATGKTIFGTGGNMQNLPKKFKKFLLADDGYVLYDIDLSQAENRIVAMIAPEPRMKDAFARGQDVHSLTGALISGQDYEQVKAHHDADIFADIGAGNKSWRFWGKQSNHALNYGLGAPSFSLRMEIPLHDAEFIRNKYLEVYPGVRQYHNWVKAQLMETRILTNILGRRRKFMLISFQRGRQSEFETAYAQIPQSSVADIINRRGLIPVYENQDTYGHVELLNQVHDSIVLQMPISIGWEEHARCLLALKNSLEQPLIWRGETFMIPAEIAMGLNNGEMVEVEAEPGSLEAGYEELVG